MARMKEILGENISSLYKTASAELARKDTQIKEQTARMVALQASRR